MSLAPGNADDPRPIYVQIMEALRRRILSGEIRERLTSEVELAQQFGTSRGTVKQAIAGLVREGLLRRHRGLGTFVNAERVESFYHEISSFTGAMKAQGLSPEVRLLHFERELPAAAEAERLKLADGEEVFRYTRSVHLDGRPIVLTESVIPAARFPGLSISAPDESLYKILRKDFGTTPFRAHDSYSPVAATGHVAEVLETAEGTPIFRVSRLSFDPRGVPIEFAVSWSLHGRLTVEISPMSLFLEETFFSEQTSAGQWHYQIANEYRSVAPRSR